MPLPTLKPKPKFLPVCRAQEASGAHLALPQNRESHWGRGSPRQPLTQEGIFKAPCPCHAAAPGLFPAELRAPPALCWSPEHRQKRAKCWGFSAPGNSSYLLATDTHLVGARQLCESAACFQQNHRTLPFPGRILEPQLQLQGFNESSSALRPADLHTLPKGSVPEPQPKDGKTGQGRGNGFGAPGGCTVPAPCPPSQCRAAPVAPLGAEGRVAGAARSPQSTSPTAMREDPGLAVITEPQDVCRDTQSHFFPSQNRL